MVRLTIGYVLLLGLITAMADAGWLSDPLERVQELPAGDKALHFVLVGVLALLVNVSVGTGTILGGPWGIVPATLLVAGLATCEELSNLAIPGRNCSLWDLTANYLGILCIGVLPLIVSDRLIPPRMARLHGRRSADV